MAIPARWIRSSPARAEALRAAWRGFARVQEPRAAPVAFWAAEEGGGFAFAVVAPLRFVPGRTRRWREWALAPALATYRQFGERAYVEGGALWLAGAPVAGCEVAAIGDCAFFSSGFLARSPGGHPDWSARNLEAAFRLRLAAQHGWEFDNSWPGEAERHAMAEALAAESAVLR